MSAPVGVPQAAGAGFRGLDRSAPLQPVQARVLDYEAGQCVALPLHACLGVIDHPEVTVIPGSAYYVHGLLAWQGLQLPLIDLAVLLRAFNPHLSLRRPACAVVVAWQAGPGQAVQHGALAGVALPRTVEVPPGPSVALPTHSDLWPELALACFTWRDQAVPVLNLAHLLSKSHA